MIRSSRRAGRGRARLARPVVRSHQLPPPVKGWNARDSLPNMREDEASILDNMVAERAQVKIRGGSDAFATGLPGAVESLLVWNGPSSSKMFAASVAAIYETSSAGAIGAAEISSLTNARWQYANFSISAGDYISLVNGADSARLYDGTTWTTPTFTGVTSANLINVNVFKNMLFYIEKDSLSFWYFPVETVSGAISEFDLGPRCTLGGYLMAAASWTYDGGDGPDDYAIFITSEGELIVYSGTDPSDASAWAHVGTFKIAPPLGRRCFLSVAAELVVLTMDGFLGLSQLLRAGRSRNDKAYSDRISGAVQDAVTSWKGNFGWEAVFYPRKNQVLVNIPVAENGTSYQYVRNTRNDAWCRFLAWDADCFAIYNDDLYFGANTVVDKADSGKDDKGAAIDVDVRQAFSYLRAPGVRKQLSMVGPMLSSSGAVSVKMHVNRDFENIAPENVVVAGAVISVGGYGPDWDTATWDEVFWADAGRPVKYWHGAEGDCDAAAFRMQVTTDETFEWTGTDILYQPGATFP